MEVPADLRYSADHEWARSEEQGVRIGITDFAQDALGDIVFVQLPKAGDSVRAGEPLGEVESTKSVSEVFAPISGTVAEVNEALVDSPERLNADPYGQGWICVVAPSDPAELDDLMDAKGYSELTARES
ncbi:MAG: glycine cleavage system protein GcvH [Actinobacteria bacterium]|nr:glycine cleavage system protein GcvH [Actinomycetota bacterium]